MSSGVAPNSQYRGFDAALLDMLGSVRFSDDSRSFPDFRASTLRITVGVGFPFTASTAPPCASSRMGGRERANLTRPCRARLTAATMSRSITRHLPHQSLRSSCLSDWSLSPQALPLTSESHPKISYRNPYTHFPRVILQSGQSPCLGTTVTLPHLAHFRGPPALVRGGW